MEKERGPQKLLFCGWRRDMDDMIMELDTYVKPGSELWLLSSVPIQVRIRALAVRAAPPSRRPRATPLAPLARAC